MDKAPESHKNQQSSEMPEQKTKPANRLVQAERFVLARALWQSKKPLPVTDALNGLKFTDAYRLKAAAYIMDLAAGGVDIKPSLLYDYMGEDGRAEAEEIIGLIGSPILTDDADDKFFKDCIRLIKNTEYENKVRELTARAETETDSEKRREILKEIMELTKRIKQL